MIVGFYLGLLAMLVALAVAAGCWWGRRRGWLAGLIAGVGAALAMLPFVPIPVHAGFTFLAAVAFEELRHRRADGDERRERRHDEQFLERLADRFAAPLRFDVVAELPRGWRRVRLAGAAEARLDSRTGLVWIGPLVWSPAAEADLAAAQSFCAGQAPAGSWALPTETELYQLWRSRGHELMPGDARSSVALLTDLPARLELGTRFAGRRPGYSLRCVALGPGAPRRGFVDGDVPAQQMNEFQLRKGELYQAR